MRLTGTFLNEELTLDTFAFEVLDGHPFTCWLKEPWRSEANFLLRQELALDFDQGDVTVESLKEDPFTQTFGTFAYPTLTSSVAKPKTRLVFCLDTPITQPQNYRRAIQALRYLYQTSDKKAIDPARFYYGAGEGGGEQEPWFNGHQLPLAKVKALIRDYEAIQPAPQLPSRQRDEGIVDGTPAPYGEYTNPTGLLRYWEDTVSSARKGERNTTLFKAAFALALAALRGALDWVEVEARLHYAAAMAGLKDAEILPTLRSAFDGAREEA